jgi:hypothetical protein
MKRFIFLVLLCLFFTGCAKEGSLVDVKQPGKDSFEVTFLFEKDGVKIYRFSDAGYYRYFSTGNGSFQPQTQSQITSTGKTTTIEHWEDGAR